MQFRYDVLFAKLLVFLQSHFGDPKLGLGPQKLSLVALEFEFLLCRIEGEEQLALLHILAGLEVDFYDLPIERRRDVV